MNTKGKSPENSTRQANKILRRNRILNIAKHLIASEGLEVFTLSQLADKAGVSVPTIHNLFGKKSDIYQELITELVIALHGVMSKPMFGDPVESAKFYVHSIVSMYTDNEDFYRAAYMVGNQEGIFDDRKSKDGFVQQSIKIAERCCVAALKEGFLLGNIETSTLTRQLYQCHRLGRQDWVYGHIDLNEYYHQVLEGMLMVYATDATPECHKRLAKELKRLNSQ